MTLARSEIFELVLLTVFIYAAWRLADWAGATFAWLPW